MRLIFDKKGIALLIVLSTLMVLTTSVVEFAYNSRVNYRLAIHAKERLEAYYLAKSALNFSRIILKYTKDNKDKEEFLEKNLRTTIYRSIIISSESLRGALGGDTSGLTGEGKESASAEASDSAKASSDKSADEEKTGEEKDMGGTDIQSGISMVSKEDAEKFLSFDGDFSSEITEEQTRYDLNKIASIVSTSPAYDQRKQLLYSLLMNPKFKDLFENQEQDAATLVHAMSDWVDSNGVINEFENVQRGNEDSLYTGADYAVKNGKMLTRGELRLIAGMADDIYQALEPFVTVYTGSEKINVCIGDADDMVKAMIYDYTNYAGCASPVKYEDEEKMTELVTTVTGACPDTSAMASALNSALGLTDLETSTTSDTSGTSSTFASSGASGSSVTGCAFQFKDLLTKDNKIFNIKATGTVGETEVNIVSALDTTTSNPNQWKVLYFRVE